MSDVRKTERYAIRRDAAGWSVYDVWTSEPAVLAMDPQTGLSEADARHTAALFNRRAKGGDRSVRQ